MASAAESENPAVISDTLASINDDIRGSLRNLGHTEARIRHITDDTDRIGRAFGIPHFHRLFDEALDENTGELDINVLIRAARSSLLARLVLAPMAADTARNARTGGNEDTSDAMTANADASAPASRPLRLYIRRRLGQWR